MRTQRFTEDSSPMNEGFLIPLSRPGEPSLVVGDFLTLGRDPSCHLVVNDTFVSSRHARIERKNGTFVLRDLQSRNGTFLNDSRIAEAVITVNDRLRIGETTYLFSETPAGKSTLTSKNIEWSHQLRRLPAFAATEFPVLITGPSGTGKEILSNAVHSASNRAKGTFISINCSALSENLIESELFGHVRGSFTGAINDRRGAFEAARGGTLFLDEIGDLPMSLQPKLLRAIENKEIRPVGSDRSIQTDVRIVAATHKNLAEAVAMGLFREDLYYRLNVCHLRPPALTDRMEDFEDLLYTFAKQYRVRLSFNAVDRLKKHSWRGNVRELKNVIARASAYFPGKHIQPEDLDQIIEKNAVAPELHLPLREPDRNASPVSVIREIEREMIIRRLVANNGNQRRTAQDLGMPKSTLHDRIKAYSIDLEVITKSPTALG